MSAQPAPERRDFFVSHAHEDRAWAEWIAWQLERTGYSVILDAWDFTAGTSFVDRMHRAVEQGAQLVAVLSPSYLRSGFAQAEWAAYFARDPRGDARRILPVQVAPCAPDGLLAQLVAIDLVGLTEQAALAALLAGVGGERNKPAIPPGFPGFVAGEAAAQPVRFPGFLPRVFTTPHLTNRYFVGRDDLLAALRGQLRSGKPVALIHGMGGVGKTQLATEYTYRYQDEYQVVAWVRAEKALSLLLEDYVSLARQLGLPGWNPEDELAAIRAVRTWLELNDRWLLVFDNAEQPGPLRDYLPRNLPRDAGRERGHVLITSRNPNWGEVADTQPLDVLPPPAAADLLLARTGGPLELLPDRA